MSIVPFRAYRFCTLGLGFRCLGSLNPKPLTGSPARKAPNFAQNLMFAKGFQEVGSPSLEGSLMWRFPKISVSFWAPYNKD